MRIEWEQHAAAFLSPADISDSFSLIADCCQTTEGILAPCVVHVLLTDDDYIHEINRTFRKTDRATDVLSFPTVNYPQGKTAKACASRLRKEFDPEAGGIFLGDIILSLPHARAQAKEYHHSLRRELCYLLAHGIFHLFGYDHMEKEDKKEMRKMEEKALQMANISRDEAAAAPSDEALLALARLAMEKSYSPYSHFKVGACLLAKDGRVFQGCNIENASFGVTNCAERTALYKAVSEGALEFSTIAIAAENTPAYPCGICRQALNEFAPDIRLLITWGNGNVQETTLPALLPHSFGPKDLA